MYYSLGFVYGNGTQKLTSKVTLLVILAVSSVGSTTEATVTSAGTETNLDTGEVSIGVNFDGFLNLTGGCETEDSAATLGVNPGVTGSVSITDPASRYIVQNRFLAGLDGIGELNISNQGLLLSGSGTLGAAVGSRGEATITGVGSSWINYGRLEVGGSGTGELHIDQGGIVSSRSADIAHASNSTSSATINGIGSSWNIAENLTLGFNGSGTLNIVNGGRLTANDVILTPIGLSNQNTITIEGHRSSLDARGGIFVGADNTASNFAGDGQFIVQQGGQVGSLFGVVGALSSNGKMGVALVSGFGSAWEMAGTLEVGSNGGVGQIDIQDGGHVEAMDVLVGIGPSPAVSTSTGQLTVDGLDSRLGTQSNLVIGNLGTGGLQVTGGGTAEADAVIIGSGSSGNAIVSGATVDHLGNFRSSQLVALTDIRVGEYNGIGNLRVEDSALIQSDNLIVGLNGTSKGTVVVNGATMFVNNQLAVGEGFDGMFSEGTLTFENGSFAHVAQRVVVGGSNRGSVGTVNVDTFSQMVTDGPVDVGLFGNGTLSIASSGLAELSGDLTVAKFIDSVGVVNLNGGGLDLRGNDIILGDGNHQFNFNDGALRNVSQFGGDLHQAGGRLELGGSGFFQPAEIAMMSILGDYTLDQLGTLVLDVQSSMDTSVVRTGQLIVQGDVSLSGDLLVDLTLMGDYSLVPGDRFNILTADSLIGEFANVFAPTFGAGLTFTTEYLSDSVNLVVIDRSASADFDNDGDVDSADLALWENSFGANALADANGDGDSDAEDFLSWQRQFSGSTNATIATKSVPEPKSFYLAACCIVALIAKQYRISLVR